jgi:glycosyltransferase involved in cell wall biosynthesis
MKKMNICFFLISGGWGGAENVVFHLAKFIEKQGHNVSIILNEETYPYFKKLTSVAIYNIGPIFTIRKFLSENFYLSLPKFILNKRIITTGIKIVIGQILIKLNFLKIRKKVLLTINTINPDVIHFHNPVVLNFCAYLLENINHPTIYTSHGIDFDQQIYLISWLNKRKKRRMLRCFTKITAVSVFIKQYLISNGIMPDIDVISNGIDLQQINNIWKNNPKINHDKEFILIFPGGQKKSKGGEILLQAIKIAKSQKTGIKLYYCGFVTADFMKKNQDKDVLFTGLLPQNEYLKLLSTCDCLTLFSKTEGFPIAILEAMALGKTILTTAVGGNCELVTDGVNGFFVERDPHKIAEKIIFIMENPELRKQISNKNIQDAKMYQWDTIADQYIQLYTSISP